MAKFSDPRTILLVDDDAGVRESMALLLEAHGWRCVTASSGANALKTLRSTPIDLIITDIFMPDYDGVELLREVAKEWPGLPIIVLSGQANWGDIDWLKMARHLGAHAVFEKTAAFEDILRGIEAALPAPPERALRLSPRK